MLGLSNKQPEENLEALEKVNSDLIVHNMPAPSRLERSSVPKSISGSQFLPMEQKHNFKAVGFLIIGGGIILVGALIYLSYVFIIKPQTKAPDPALVQNVSNPVQDDNKISAESSSPENTGATTTSVSEIGTSTVVDLTGESVNSSTDLIASSTEVNIEEEFVAELPPLQDTDADGVNDNEEAVFGTNALQSDSDSDGYSDLAEIQKGYNPNEKGAKLYSGQIFSPYENKVAKYSIFYPAAWSLKSLNNDYTTIISAPDNSLIQISVSDNTNIQSIMGWYEMTFPDETITYDRLKNGNNWEGIMGADGLNFYLTDNKRENIYVVSYIPSIFGRLVYPTIFQAIIDSFQVN